MIVNVKNERVSCSCVRPIIFRIDA